MHLPSRDNKLLSFGADEDEESAADVKALKKKTIARPDRESVLS